jgi:hypothetical protein
MEKKIIRRVTGATPDANGRTVDFDHLRRCKRHATRPFERPKCVVPLEMLLAVNSCLGKTFNKPYRVVLFTLLQEEIYYCSRMQILGYRYSSSLLFRCRAATQCFRSFSQWEQQHSKAREGTTYR